MDCELRYKQYIARTAAKQLFVATVAPVIEYAASVWMHACRKRALSWLNRAQKIGALAITGAFRTVAAAVAEAEASIDRER